MRALYETNRSIVIFEQTLSVKYLRSSLQQNCYKQEVAMVLYAHKGVAKFKIHGLVTIYD